MRSFYLRFRVHGTENWPYFGNISTNLQSSLFYLYALYASKFFRSLSLAYNEGNLYRQNIGASFRGYKTCFNGLSNFPKSPKDKRKVLENERMDRKPSSFLSHPWDYLSSLDRFEKTFTFSNQKFVFLLPYPSSTSLLFSQLFFAVNIVVALSRFV